MEHRNSAASYRLLGNPLLFMGPAVGSVSPVQQQHRRTLTTTHCQRSRTRLGHQPIHSTQQGFTASSTIYIYSRAYSMTWISKLATAVGLVLLAHSCYSAQEFSSFQALRASATSQPTLTALPVDITIETIVALLITTVGLVLGTQPLKPIKWRVWAGKVEREGRDVPQSAGDENDKDFFGNPFRFLESRPGFVDIRRQRKNFGDWAREGGQSK